MYNLRERNLFANFYVIHNFVLSRKYTKIQKKNIFKAI